MDYERKDSMEKAMHGKEPQKLEYSMKAGGKGNKLQTLAEKRMKRKDMLNKEYEKWAKSQLDPTLDK
jgi:hypothetical protein